MSLSSYQGDYNCSSLPARLGGYGQFEKKEDIWGNLTKFYEILRNLREIDKNTTIYQKLGFFFYALGIFVPQMCMKYLSLLMFPWHRQLSAGDL